MNTIMYANTNNTYYDYQHDERVMKGEQNGNLFPKPVYEEPPQEQRARMVQSRRKKVAK